jgi:hypothetical protein
MLDGNEALRPGVVPGPVGVLFELSITSSLPPLLRANPIVQGHAICIAYIPGLLDVRGAVKLATSVLLREDTN